MSEGMIIDESNESIERLNDDCLITTFMALSFDDLMNVADTSDRLVGPAQFVFKKKFSESVIDVTNNNDKYSSIALLKNFGHLISKLRVTYDDKCRGLDKQLENGIVENCHQTLLEIEICGGMMFTFDGPKKIFEKLRSFKYNDGWICSMMTEFHIWFPNVKTLELKKINASNRWQFFIKMGHFPTVEHFAVSNRLTENRPGVDATDIVTFISKNPQLKSLSIEGGIWIDRTFVQSISDCLPLLEKLILSSSRTSDDWVRVENQPIRFNNLRNLTVHFRDAKVINTLSITANRLEVLNLYGETYRDVKPSLGHLNGIIAANRNARILNVRGRWTCLDNVSTTICAIVKMRQLRKLQLPFDLTKLKWRQINALMRNCNRMFELSFNSFIYRIDDPLFMHDAEWERRQRSLPAERHFIEPNLMFRKADPANREIPALVEN